MLALIDESLPRRLRRELPGFEVVTVQKQGWSSLENGELLRNAEIAGFEGFITADQNIQYQQSLSKTKLRIIVLATHSNRFAEVRQLAPEIVTALREMLPGELRVIRGDG